MKKSIDNSIDARQRARIQRNSKLSDKIRHSGLAGQRIGKHIVGEGAPDVQLGEDLTESLRGLKVRMFSSLKFQIY